jgi:hypothetical protein
VAVQPVWEVHPEPSGDGLGQGREDDLVELLAFQQLGRCLQRVCVPEVAVGTQAAQVVQELAQPMPGVLGGETVDGRVADGGSDGGTLAMRAARSPARVLGTST